MRLVPTAIAALLAGAAAAWLGAGPVRGATIPAALYVSGLHVDGSKPTALVDLGNRAESAADYYALSVLFFHADGHRAADDLDVVLTPGHATTLNVGAIVGAYRDAHEIAPFKGPIQLVIYGSTCVDLGLPCPNGDTPRPFGPDVIHVAAVQSEGAATYDAAVSWRAAQ